MTRPVSATSLYARLRDACASEWTAYTQHPFVRQLADGTLPEACFRHYLIQDYLFLIHFARAYGLATFKSETLDDIRRAAGGLSAIVDTEMDLHVTYCARWGLTEKDMAAAPEAPATMAYTRYVLERGLAGDLLDLQVALALCIVGYAEIGRALADDPATIRHGKPYDDWIEMYASEDYQNVSAEHVQQMDVLMRRRGADGRLDALVRTFSEATRLEAAFWDMGLAAEDRG